MPHTTGIQYTHIHPHPHSTYTHSNTQCTKLDYVRQFRQLHAHAWRKAQMPSTLPNRGEGAKENHLPLVDNTRFIWSEQLPPFRCHQKAYETVATLLQPARFTPAWVLLAQESSHCTFHIPHSRPILTIEGATPHTHTHASRHHNKAVAWAQSAARTCIRTHARCNWPQVHDCCDHTGRGLPRPSTPINCTTPAEYCAG